MSKTGYWPMSSCAFMRSSSLPGLPPHARHNVLPAFAEVTLGHDAGDALLTRQSYPMCVALGHARARQPFWHMAPKELRTKGPQREYRFAARRGIIFACVMSESRAYR